VNDQQPTEPLTGDHFAQIVRDLGGPLVLYARQLCTQPEDIVQEALLKLLAEGQAPSNVRAWLFRVVRHAALNNARGEQRRRKYEEHFGNQSRDWFEPSVSQLLEMKEAMYALRQLPSEERETIVARLWGDLTLDEIATLTETSLSTAQRRYVRGLERLRRVFHDDEQKSCKLQRGTL
jgi:RNA polymerase sigma-70 factor (ECF subfamily)